MEEALLKISGNVQGVGFRSLAQKIARSLKIAGWAKNQPDGTVLILAQGAKESLQLFEKRLASINLGLSGPRVDSIVAQEKREARDFSPHPDFLVG